ncbi:membrane protein [Streptomyces olivaceoviridis]|uniref:MMPL family transporter n=1 Tax=Streptomyces olivaceoviridis TaxID=1921 RepID=UPI001679DDA5|nr:MMPL family transporter [Streptomyces olivaceoviridis]GGZ20854.1 membrane protein [Streptomyces olivaceoviridis]
MATLLYRLGRFAFRRRRLVLLAWLALLVAAGIGVSSVSGSTTDDFTLPGTQSQRAIDLLEKEFPQAAASGATARVVIEAADGERLTAAAHKPRAEALVDDLRRAPQVANVVDPFSGGLVSASGTIAYAQVTYAVPPAEMSTAASDALHEVVRQGAEAGLTVSLGGNAVVNDRESNAGELIGLLVAAFVLVITFGSLVAAGLPLLSAIVGVGIALIGVTIASSFVDMASNARTLALMLGLAVAVDYALFIVSRYRGELREGHKPEEAAGRALGTAGSAVVFAGLTVIIALVGLSVIGIAMLTTMGLAAAFAIIIAVLVALTLLPALLGFTGTRVAGSRLSTPRMRAVQRGRRTSMGVRWGRFVARHPGKMLLASVVGLGVLALPALSLRLTLPDDSMAAPGSTQRVAYDTLSKGFGPGFNGPLTVVVDARGSDDAKAAATDTTAMLDGLGDIATVRPPVFNQAGDVALITAVPGSSPTSRATADLVAEIRERSGTVEKDSGAQVMVTGTTAVNIDVSAKLGEAMVPYLAIVVGLALVLLLVVFRSVLVPLKAALGFLLSVGATLGVLVAVFQWGWLKDLFGVDETAPIVSLLPILLIGVVFGLAMDYEVFLVAGMREAYVHGASPTEAVVTGFRYGARVVTAAAVIMISVFAGFLLDDVALVKSIGMGLATAVLFDAFVVRMTIVPAVMTLLQDRAWWLPAWLDRVLPEVDIEGEKLRRVLDARDRGGHVPTPAGQGLPPVGQEPAAPAPLG